jgi:hypothetical protein
MNKCILWTDLTDEEKEQAEVSYLSILEDMAADGDVYDKADYECKRDDRLLRLTALQHKTFIRDADGYIFVNI